MEVRELRYIRLATDNLDQDTAFAGNILGLQLAEKMEGYSYLRSDFRACSLCYCATDDGDAVAFTVGEKQDLDNLKARLSAFEVNADYLDAAACEIPKIKAGLTWDAPNGVKIEFVWRPMSSGWRYHGPRDAGLTGLQSVLMACTDIAVNERFWTEILGGTVSDWAGDTAYIRFDDSHHRVALYPSKKDGILGVDFAVEGINNIMQNFYFLKGRQVPVVQGPGLQTASNKKFVVAKGPRGVLYSYSAGMAEGTEVTDRIARQFSDEALSHCAWGSDTVQPEFLGKG